MIVGKRASSNIGSTPAGRNCRMAGCAKMSARSGSMPTPRQEQSDAILVPGQRGDVEPGRFGGPQRRRETDEQRRGRAARARCRDRPQGRAQQLDDERGLFGAAGGGRGGSRQSRRHRGRGGRRRVAGEEMQIAQRRVAQP